MDFSRLQAVSKVNPVGQKFNIQWKPQKEMFRLSDKMFDNMKLEYNSLNQFNDFDENEKLVGVYLAVCPGNSGLFHKKQKGKIKGKSFKNKELSKALTDLGITPDTIDIEYKGSNGNMEMYQLISTRTEVVETVIASEEANIINENVTEDKF
jgi:hypothetical protein